MEESINQISATEFKKHFLSLVDKVKIQHDSFIITKRNLPVAKIVPIETKRVINNKSYFGCLKGTMKIADDIVDITFANEWEAHYE